VYATLKLLQFLWNPTSGYIAAADRVIAYLYSTRTLAIKYVERAMADIFLCLSNVAFADDKSTRQSLDGYLF
jgi:hypothetical protein